MTTQLKTFPAEATRRSPKQTARPMSIKKPKQDQSNRRRNGSHLMIGPEAWQNSKLRLTTDHEGVNKCLDYVAKNFQRPIQLKHLAKAAGLSRRGFMKAFQKHVGERPGVLLRTVRLEHAKRLLMKRDLNSADIARRSGFRSNNTFAVAFRRDIGMAPKQFQREYFLSLPALSTDQSALTRLNAENDFIIPAVAVGAHLDD